VPAGPVAVEIPDQLTVELQEVRRQLDDVPEAGVAGAGVVDGDADPSRQPRDEIPPERVVVLDRLLLVSSITRRSGSWSSRSRAKGRPAATG